MISVLIVDDDPDLLEMVGTLLELNGLEVHCVNKAVSFISILAKANPDLILMDIFLDTADGRNLCFNLKQSEEYKHLPVILYSAGVLTSGSIERSLADEFIRKPFDNKELVNRIKFWANKATKA